MLEKPRSSAAQKIIAEKSFTLSRSVFMFMEKFNN
jgi:hypothetical protein